MRFFRRFAPAGAVRDLRHFLSHRQPHQWGFMALAVTLVGVTLWAFNHDSHFEPEYHREIVYFQQWPLTRSDAEIVAQQKVDGIQQTRRIAEEVRRRDANRRAFKKIDDGLRRWGI